MKLSLGQMSMIATAVGLPGDPDTWAAVGMAESGGDSNIVNSIGCVGIWQINQPVWVKSHPTWTVKWLQNPLNNAIAAKAIYKAQGWGAWQAYTGPDGSGSDGPWKDAYKKDAASTVPAGWLPDPKHLLEGLTGGAEELMPDVPGMDAFGAIADGVAKTADVLANPRTWLRVGYGVMGGVLVIGGLLLMVRNSDSIKKINSAVVNAASSTPQGKAAGAAKAASSKPAAASTAAKGTAS